MNLVNNNYYVYSRYFLLCFIFAVLGLQIQCSSSEFIVGENVECSCSSDLDPISIEWYQRNTSVQQSSDSTRTNITIPVTADTKGLVYRCLMTSSCGTQQKMMMLNAKGVL